MFQFYLAVCLDNLLIVKCSFVYDNNTLKTIIFSYSRFFTLYFGDKNEEMLLALGMFVFIF